MTSTNLKDGNYCKVILGTYTGKSGIVQDINTSKTGHIIITVLLKDGVRFRTIGKSLLVTKYE